MTLGATASCLIAALTALLIPMVPGGQVDTRRFDRLPRWQFRAFNAALIALGTFGLVVAFLAPGGSSWALTAAAVVGGGYLFVFALDLGRVFPVVEDPLPPILVALEVQGGMLGAVLVTVSLIGVLS